MEASELRCQDVIVESKKGWASKIEVQSRRKDCKNVVMYVCVCVCALLGQHTFEYHADVAQFSVPCIFVSQELFNVF